MRKVLVGIVVVVLVAIVAFYEYQSSMRPQPQAADIVVQGPGTQSASEQGVTCHESDRYFMVVRSHGDSVGSDILVKYKTSANENIPCAYAKGAGDYELDVANEPDYFLALVGKHLLLDSGTAPDPRALIVYDLEKRSRVFTDRYARPIDITISSATYWSPVSEQPTDGNCPNLADYVKNGLGAEIEARVALDFATLEKHEAGSQRCQATQG